MNQVFIAILVIVLLAVTVVFAPLATIWSLNTLFGMTIEYSIWTWLAAVWLSATTFGGLQAALKVKV